MTHYTGREHPHDITLDDVPFVVVRDKQMVPEWAANSVPQLMSQQSGTAEVPRPWDSWHMGFGYSYTLGPAVYHWCSGLDPRFPRTIIMGPLVTTTAAQATVIGFFEESGKLYSMSSRYIQQVDTSNDTLATAPAAPGDATGLDLGSGNAVTSALSFDGKAVLLLGESDDGYTFSNATWTALSTVPVRGSYLAKFWANTYYALARTYNAAGGPSVVWISEGSALDVGGNWGSVYPIGDGDTTYKPITGLCAVDQTLYAARPDGLFPLDKTGRTPCVLPIYSIGTSNGIDLQADSAGYVWYPTVEGYYRYAEGTAVDCSPGRGLPNESPIYGRITAHVQYKGWRFASVYNGTDSYIMCGRDREQGEDGIGPIIWHGALVKVTGQQVRGMWITTITSPPRLYWGAGAYVSYVRLPANGDNPLTDSSGYRFAPSGSIWLSADEWGTTGTQWALTGLDFEAEGLSSTTYIDVYAALDHGAYSYVGRVQTSGRTTLWLPESSSWRFNRCSIRLDFTNGASTSTPKLRAVVGRAVQRPIERDIIQTRLFCSDEALTRFSIQTRRTGQDQLTQLKVMSEVGPVVLVDYWTGTRRSRRVLVRHVREQIVKYPDVQAAEQVAQVELVVVEGVSPTPALYGTAVYGTDRYNSVQAGIT